MAPRTRPPFRADHVGSLLRPPALLQAREARARNAVTAHELRTIEDEAIREAVRRQEDIGLQAVTDGEFRRIDWFMDFKYAIGGVEKLTETVKVPFRSATGATDFEFVAYRIGERLRLDDTIFAEDFAFLKSVATKAIPKLTIPSPSMMHYPAGRGVDRSVYPDWEMFYDDLAAIYRKQIEGLAGLGCTYLQLDDTSLSFLNDPARRAMLGEGAETQHLRYIKLFNDAVAERPSDMAICTHTCRGNYKSAWMAEGSYDHVAEALFSELDVDGFFLEYDDERSGGFEPLRFLPKGKMVVLGLVTTKSGKLESKDELKRRIDEAAKFAPLEQLCLSPQCGFASTAEGNLLTVDEQFAKLSLVVETAREVWGEA
ncbi:5-methyltetrahydropteroyltriglutamate--homocysteine S-methyltransferase [Pseudorhodoplanes sp.]|uniref:5-methyltetrahydropteroyltriglutamate-- homocysteine S-methyltransferase n=1 Tax=Pseudorhodoplanes sp. TaxID=1934341 RepID=UPI00391B5D2B